jgi:hypothetical protein
MFRPLFKSLLAIIPLTICGGVRAGEDIEYPQIEAIDGGSMKVHHPVIDSWPDFESVTAWIPVEITQADSERTWIGSVRARASTRVNTEEREVLIFNQQILDLNFPAGDVPRSVLNMAEQVVVNRPRAVSLDVLLNALADDFEVPAQGRGSPMFSFDPPRIVVSTSPMQLLLIDKEPILAPISGTGLEFVVNSDWRLFYHTEAADWIVLNDGSWQRNSLLATGGWTTTTELPKDFQQLALGDQWEELREAIPPQMPAVEPAPFLVSLEPTELVVIDGDPKLGNIVGSEFSYVTNTGRDLFRLNARWYLLTTGRWFESGDLEGRWQPVADLPAAFSAIPEDHPKAGVRSAVPGTVESMVALLEASVPRRKAVSKTSGSNISVGYVGNPQFEPVDGTSLTRAVNTPFYVFQHNNYFYLAHEAAWYFSRNPNGPWEVALAVPDEIYRIPATDPAHHVTYLFVAKDEKPADGEVYFTHNSGYLGEYSSGISVVQGTGWYYQPWVYHDPRGYPVYWSHPWTYGFHYRHPGFYGHPFGYYGGYWGTQSVTLTGEQYGINGAADPAFQDPKLARRGLTYTTLAAQRQADTQVQLNAADDYYSDASGRVYRRSEEGWSQHTESGWNTMGDLERQYGTKSGNSVGDVQYQPQQEQAYKQRQRDEDRMEDYYRRRQRGYNMHASVAVYR